MTPDSKIVICTYVASARVVCTYEGAALRPAGG
jgi:hypothetical protein